nr:MAG TPA: DnaK suppressor protein [Caudoviricetes sp.]
MAGKCRDCGAPIIWERTKNKNPIPCNPKALYYIPDREGDIYVLTNSGEVIKAREGIEQGEVARVGVVPHFATCKARKPQKKKIKLKHEDIAEKAKEYRRKREAAKAEEEARIAKRCAEIQAAYEESQRIKQLSLLPDDFIGCVKR